MATAQELKAVADAITSAGDDSTYIDMGSLADEVDCEIEPARFQTAIDELAADGHIEVDDQLIWITAKGFRAAYGSSFETESLIKDLGLR